MHGQSLPSIVAQPFKWTGYAFLLIAERERVEAPLRRLEHVRQGQRAAAAFNDPPRLWREEADIIRALERGPRQELSLPELLRIAREMDAKVKAGTPVPVEQS